MSIIYAPHITYPKGGETFNRGTVSITWNRNNPPEEDEYGSVSNTSISYEIEHTDNYNLENTVWNTVKRRISGTEESYQWIVGKMIKSSKTRIRIRARSNIDGTVSDWSMISGDFSVNVFKLIPPSIVSPLSNHIYTDYVLIILDETLTKETFSQKVRYTLEYYSKKREANWTKIVSDIPFGQNAIRWNTESLLPSDDYVLRLTVKNFSTSCKETSLQSPDQIGYRYVYNISIQQPGMFIIDTKPPKAILEVEDTFGVTNEINHTINIYAEDETTEVKEIQIRECDSTSQIGLGDISDIIDAESDCTSIEDLIAGDNIDFSRIIGKPQGYSSKISWKFNDKSGLRKLEAMVSDFGGNTSLQESCKIFLPIFKTDNKIFDFIITQEQRDKVTIEQDSNGNVVINNEPSTYEVAYIATSGQYWILEPFPRLVYESSSNREIRKLFLYYNNIYIFTYANNEIISDKGVVFRDDKIQSTSIYTFPSSLSVTNDVAQFKTNLYIGLENGELYKYDGSSFSNIKTFPNSIKSLAGDEQYLYIAFSNSELISLYNGSEFFTASME